VLGNADGNRFDALLRRGIADGACREDGDFVFGAAAAEQQHGANHRPIGMLPSRYFRSSSRQRMPPPNVKAVLLRILSTPLVMKSRGVFGFSCRKMYSPYRRRCGFGSRRWL